MPEDHTREFIQTMEEIWSQLGAMRMREKEIGILREEEARQERDSTEREEEELAVRGLETDIRDREEILKRFMDRGEVDFTRVFDSADKAVHAVLGPRDPELVRVMSEKAIALGVDLRDHQYVKSMGGVFRMADKHKIPMRRIEESLGTYNACLQNSRSIIINDITNELGEGLTGAQGIQSETWGGLLRRPYYREKAGVVEAIQEAFQADLIGSNLSYDDIRANRAQIISGVRDFVMQDQRLRGFLQRREHQGIDAATARDRFRETAAQIIQDASRVQLRQPQGHAQRLEGQQGRGGGVRR